MDIYGQDFLSQDFRVPLIRNIDLNARSPFLVEAGKCKKGRFGGKMKATGWNCHEELTHTAGRGLAR